MNNLFGTLLFLLNPPPAPPPSNQPPPDNGLSYEEQIEYESRWQSCAGTFDPEQCRADLYEEYYG